MHPTLFKISAALSPSIPHSDKLDTHFVSTDKSKWRTFKRNLRAKTFLDALKQDDRADEKLKRFAEMVHLHMVDKSGPTHKIHSDSGNSYLIKYHKNLDRYSCSCPDWTYDKSIKKSGELDCKHIKKINKEKIANVLMPIRLAYLTNKSDKANEEALKAKITWNAYKSAFHPHKEKQATILRGQAASSLRNELITI